MTQPGQTRPSFAVVSHVTTGEALSLENRVAAPGGDVHASTSVIHVLGVPER